MKHEKKENRVQNMFNDQKSDNHLEDSNRTNQFQVRVVRKRRDPLAKMIRELCKMEEKTSRSQEIDVNSCYEETVSSISTGRPVVETSVIQARSSEDSKDPNVGTTHERTRRLFVGANAENVSDSSQTRSCHESKTFNVGDETLRERTEGVVVDHDTLSPEQQTMLNEVNMDFRIPGLPHSVVQHAQSTGVRELIQKIENRPDRHALRQDLRQNQAYNPFCPESKKMIRKKGNIELFELLKTDPKTQCTACLSYLGVGIVYCTCGHFLQKETGVQSRFRKKKTDFFHCQSMSSRREDFMTTDMAKRQETKNIISLTN